jgi:hypothetical protein
MRNCTESYAKAENFTRQALYEYFFNSQHTKALKQGVQNEGDCK